MPGPQLLSPVGKAPLLSPNGARLVESLPVPTGFEARCAIVNKTIMGWMPVYPWADPDVAFQTQPDTIGRVSGPDNGLGGDGYPLPPTNSQLRVYWRNMRRRWLQNQYVITPSGDAGPYGLPPTVNCTLSIAQPNGYPTCTGTWSDWAIPADVSWLFFNPYPNAYWFDLDGSSSYLSLAVDGYDWHGVWNCRTDPAHGAPDFHQTVECAVTQSDESDLPETGLVCDLFMGRLSVGLDFNTIFRRLMPWNGGWVPSGTIAVALQPEGRPGKQYGQSSFNDLAPGDGAGLNAHPADWPEGGLSDPNNPGNWMGDSVIPNYFGPPDIPWSSGWALFGDETDAAFQVRGWKSQVRGMLGTYMIKRGYMCPGADGAGFTLVTESVVTTGTATRAQIITIPFPDDATPFPEPDEALASGRLYFARLCWLEIGT